MIEAKGINISFGGKNLFAKDITIKLEDKQFTLLYGPSGSGKTTLFEILAVLNLPSKGEIRWGDELVDSLNYANKNRFYHITTIYSVFNFIETLSIKDNILLPALFAKESNIEEMLKGLEELFVFKDIDGEKSQIDLKDLMKKNISDLSNGQKEIIAISRALLLSKPKYLFADELLRSFNEELEEIIWEKILSFLVKYDKSLFMITHKKHLAKSLIKFIEDKSKNTNETKSRILTIEKHKLVEK
ncbi:MAG: ATP-binding cassette domain-containing protein [Campylobacterota bacterium]|nr:ATP-binding cassette domain-containing protein [Campylobacterota bacterium]